MSLSVTKGLVKHKKLNKKQTQTRMYTHESRIGCCFFGDSGNLNESVLKLI